MIFTSYFNYFNNSYRIKSIENFKKKYKNFIISGISDIEQFNYNYKSKDKLFLKENLLNLAINKNINSLDYIFWIDNDVYFIDNDWYTKAVDKLESGYDVIQLFNKCYHFDNNYTLSSPIPGFVFNKQKNNLHGHCGFAWAMKKELFLHLEGLYEFNIAGTGDGIMARCFIQEKIATYSESLSIKNKFAFFPFSENHCKTIQNYYNKCKDIKTGYLEGDVYHEYHGELQRRNYLERYKIYEDNKFDPINMLYKYDGVIQIKEQYNKLKYDIEDFLKFKETI